ncbi:unnamed protein product [Cuscuta europaea]|uniref:Reverse transcriptase Ty1/copia-type domain-containing protein n=1 Tax=Cuscuta europaea TaxID=41803 RepID=A0A9P0ZA52_CUSEU|nr:unnamed protein product [Cuscuta europaea]
MKRTILEKDRCMLIESGLKNSMWGEAVVTSTYLINRSPSSVVGFKTPQEMWSGVKPNITYLRPFGCTAYSHVSQGKLEPRAIKCVMIGYPEGVKGYKLLLIQPGVYKGIISRDVTFNESEFHFKSVNASSSDMTDDSDGNFFNSLGTENLSEGDLDVGGHHEGNDDQSLSECDQDDSSEGTAQLNTDSNQEGSTLPLLDNLSNLHDVPVLFDVNVNTGETDLNGNASNEQEEPNLANYQLVRDKEHRNVIPNRKYISNLAEFIFIASEIVKNNVLETFEQAIKSSKSNEWVKAMQEELQFMFVNQTWILVPKLIGAKVIDCRWIYRIKDSLDPIDLPKYKVRLVAKGFKQKKGIDYQDIFAPVIKFKTLRLLLVMIVVFDWELEQMDGKTAFLHGDINETIYMSQPPGYESKKNPNHVC